MNKYLLLRDNKQSGPYTVSEIVAKGIKPYDLVWLEGKSAAWRYPSEVEELKSYAPAVEEQPFDRFFKKPEQVRETSQTASVATQHSIYEPKVAVTMLTEDPQTSKKVYINFPGGGQIAAIAEAKQPATESFNAKELKNEKPAIYPERASHTEPIEEMASWNSNSYYTRSVPATKSSDKRLLYGAVVACLILIAFIGVLLVDYFNQRESLRTLNNIVKQMENKQNVEQQNIAATLVNHDVPQQTSETIVNPEALITDEEKPVDEKTSTVKNVAGKARKNNTAAIVFKETIPTDETLAPKADIATDSEKPEITTHENLFKLVSVKPNKYKTGLLGGISNLKLELTNNSLHELHKVSIEIQYLGPEKKVVKKQTVYFENVSPGEQTTLDVPKSNRGVSIDYTITDIKS